MAQSLRNLQIFRNGELLTGSVAVVKGLINDAFTDGTIVLKDGEPISIRYKETNESTEIKSLFGVAYIPENGIPSILWNESGITIDTNPQDNAYVTLNYDVDASGNYTLTVGTQIAESIENADTDNNGLVTAVQVKGAIETAVNGIVTPELPEYTITALKDAKEGYLKSYQLTKDGIGIGEVINIPKDYLVKSASIIDVTEDNKPQEDLIVGKYIDFVINTQSNDGNVEHLYINVTDLVDAYVAGKDISITDNNTINVSLSNGITPNTTVGFVSPTNPIPAGASLEDVLRKILVKEVEAISVPPTNSLSVSVATKREVGTALGTITLIPSYTDGYYKSSDTAVYTDEQFNTNNNTTNGKLNAKCAAGAVTYYKGTATITDQVSETDGFQYVDNTKVTENTTYSFQITTAYDASTVNECKTSSNATQTISIPSGTTSPSPEVKVEFYHKTYVSSIQGLVWDTAKGYLVKDGVQYVPETTLKDTMSTNGEFLTSTTQNKSKTYTIPGSSSLCVIVPQNVTFSIYSTADSNKTNNLREQCEKYSTTNTNTINYDIYIYPNNGTASMDVTGLTYSKIE